MLFAVPPCLFNITTLHRGAVQDAYAACRWFPRAFSAKLSKRGRVIRPRYPNTSQTELGTKWLRRNNSPTKGE